MNPLAFIALVVLDVTIAAVLSVRSNLLATVVFWPSLAILIFFLCRERPVRVVGNIMRTAGSHMEM